MLIDDIIIENREYNLLELQSLKNKLEKSNNLALESSKSSPESESKIFRVAYSIAGTVIFAFQTQSVELPQMLRDDNIIIINDNHINTYITNNLSLDPYIKGLKKYLPSSGGLKDDIICKIIGFKSLNESWDGYGALPLEVKSASNAINFIHHLDMSLVNKISDVYPNTNGTVSIKWEDGDERISLDAGNESFSYYVKFNSQKPKFYNNILFNNVEAITVLAESISAL